MYMYDGRGTSEQCSCKTLTLCILLSIGILICNESSKQNDKYKNHWSKSMEQ